MREELLSFLESKRVYNDFVRTINAYRYDTVSGNVSLAWVDPDEINVMQMEADETPTKLWRKFNRVDLHAPDKARFNPYHYAGMVVGGDWDLFVKPHEYDRVYRGLKEHIEEGVPLDETEYGYQYKLREETYQDDGYLEQEIETTVELIESIRENGFQSRYEMGQLERGEPPFLQEEQWCVTVNVGRDGEYIFNNTAHNRLALSKLLGVDEIPVVVVVTHPDAV